MGTETMFLAGVTGLTVLIFLERMIDSTVSTFFVKSSMGWTAPSYVQFFNLVVASIMAGGS